uniref:Ataxin 7 like 2 n=1 Tax=Serinus canaria TaxID=9135 RepID=A0A8C9L1Y9_SERCA
MICLSGLILSGLIVPGAVMPGPPLCGSTGTIRVPATDRILSLAGSGSELEENGKSGSKKLDTMTLIKEERRHGPLSKLYARATACHVAVNGQPVPGRTPGAAKALQEKLPGARGRAQPLPEHTDKDNNLCLFVPVVNLEKIPSIPKPDGHGIKVPPKAVPTNSKESLGKPAAAAVPKEPPVGAPRSGCSMPSPRVLGGVLGSPPALPSTLCLRVPPGKECDLNRQCGVRNPDTNKLCTRLLTCKIHSVHQRREVQGRAKDFDVLVAELKASTRRGDPPKDRSPPEKEPLHPALQDTPSLLQPPNTPPCRARARLSSASDPEDAPATSAEGSTGGLPLPLPLPKGGSHVSSEESEEEGAEEPPRTPVRPPRPQAFCTFGSRLVTPGCYVFDRRLDRFCAALGSMLEQHLSHGAGWLCLHCHDITPLSRPTRGTSGPGLPLLPQARIPPLPAPVPAVLRTERRRMLADSLPPSSRGVTGAGLGPGPGMGSERYRARCGGDRAGPGPDEPNRVKRSRTERIPAGPNRAERSRRKPSGPRRTKPGRTGPGRTFPIFPELSRAEPIETTGAEPVPNAAERFRPGPNAAEPPRSAPGRGLGPARCARPGPIGCGPSALSQWRQRAA